MVLVSQDILGRDRKIIEQIRENCSPELLLDITQDPNFLHHLQDDEFVERLTPRKIKKHLEDVQKLTKMQPKELEEEYAHREIERTKRNTRNITNNLLGITVNAFGFDLTCKAQVTFETMATIQDMVGKTLSAGTYKTYTGNKKGGNKIGISSGEITSICIINKEGINYEFPKDHGKEVKVVEY